MDIENIKYKCFTIIFVRRIYLVQVNYRYLYLNNYFYIKKGINNIILNHIKELMLRNCIRLKEILIMEV